MSIIKKTFYQCSLCKTEYTTKLKAKKCFDRCSELQEKKEAAIKKAKDWFEENPPLFKKGDLVCFKQDIDIRKLGYCNRFFIVTDVVKSTQRCSFDKPYWFCHGIAGRYENIYGTSDDTEVRLCKEECLELCMDAAEYSEKEKEIIEKAKASFTEGTAFFVHPCSDTKELKLSLRLPIESKN